MDETNVAPVINSLESAKARIPRNVLCNWVSYAVGLLVTFLIAPFMVHRLGNTVYGVWALIGQVIEYSFLFDFGVRIAATRYVARHLALDQPDEINRVVTSGLALSFVSVVLAVAAGGAVAWALPRFFPIPPELISHARWSVLVLALGIAVAFPGSLFSACVAADSRYEFLAIRKSAPGIVRLLLLWLFLARGGGLLTVAVVTTLAVCVGYLLDFVFTLRLFRNLSIRRRFFDRAMLKTLINFSLYAFVLSIAWRLIFMTDNVVVGFFLGPVAVTFYTVGMNLAGLLRDSLGNITTVYAPLAYQMDALEQKDTLRRLFISGSRIALVYALPGVLGMVILGPRFLGFWMGESFIRPSGRILILLSAEVVFYALSFTAAQVLYAVNRHKVNAWLSLSNAGVNLTLSVILVRWVGAVGVAWGTVIPAFVAEAIIVPVYTASLLQASPLRFYRSAVLRPLMVSVPYGLWLWFCLAQGLVTGYASLALVVAAGLVAYTLLAWKFSFDTGEKAWARQRLADLKSALTAIRPAWGATQEL
jgi:O-antigen/teichoic acid export membrane protein